MTNCSRLGLTVCGWGLMATATGLGAAVLTQGVAHAATPKAAPVLLVVGDSLSAEYGLARGRGWVALLEKRASQEKLPVRVVNASISGDTTSGGRSRLPSLLTQHRPSVVIVELGGNDALRGLPLRMTRDNLLAMTQAAKAAGAQVVLAGMQLPPNYGKRYADDFARLFGEVATQEKTALVPFLLRGVADVPDAEKYFQADRIHPNEAAHPLMLSNVWPVVAPLLRRPTPRKPT